MKTKKPANQALTFSILLYFGALFTSSFDVFLVADIGMTFRTCQALLAVTMFLAIVKSIHKSKSGSPPGIWSLSAWTVVATLAMALHGVTMRSVGYSVWLAFNVFAIWATIQLFDTHQKIVFLIRYYIWSFVFVACFGIVQFFAGALGLGNLLVRQWWIDGRLPRVNGFSYEPSYFATYLLIGWVLIGYMLEQPRQHWPTRRLPLHFLTISIALLLSSSRMGIVAMALWGLRCLWVIVSKPGISRSISIKILASATVAASIGAIMIAGAGAAGFGKYTFLLEGTGLGGTATQSVSERSTGVSDVIDVFLDHPILGVGLGGISEEIMIKKGIPYDPKRYEGICVGAEMLAGTGIVGFTFLVAYFAILYRSGLKLCRKLGNSPEATLVKALLYSLTAELIILQFNQNILRPYLWLQIAVMSAVIAFLKNTARARYVYTNTSVSQPVQLPSREFAGVVSAN